MGSGDDLMLLVAEEEVDAQDSIIRDDASARDWGLLIRRVKEGDTQVSMDQYLVSKRNMGIHEDDLMCEVKAILHDNNFDLMHINLGKKAISMGNIAKIHPKKLYQMRSSLIAKMDDE
jgi:hypothetical protein